MDILKENITILYGAMGIALVLLLVFLYQKKATSGIHRSRSRREGFQNTTAGADGTAETPARVFTPADFVIDKNVVCPPLLETLKAQLKQRETVINLPVDITKTPEFQQIVQMIRLSHKNMLDLECPDVPSLPAM